MKFDWRMAAVVGFSLVLCLRQVGAQSLRDPTVAPTDAGQTSNAVEGKSTTTQPGAMTIIVRSGRPFLVVGTRLYAQGQKIGQARIERISETGVWLREGGVLRKVPQFSGIQRSTVTPVSARPTCAGNATKPAHPVASCTDAKP